MKAIIIILAALCLIGCSKDYKVEISSNTDWTGQVSGRSVSGSGSQTIDMDDTPPECAVIIKQTEGGNLQAQIVWSGGFFLNPNGEKEAVSTSAPFGSVTVCID